MKKYCLRGFEGRRDLQKYAEIALWSMDQEHLGLLEELLLYAQEGDGHDPVRMIRIMAFLGHNGFNTEEPQTVTAGEWEAGKIILKILCLWRDVETKKKGGD